MHAKHFSAGFYHGRCCCSYPKSKRYKIMTFINPTMQYGIDSFTLHRWVLNDASGPFSNKGSSSSTTLTIQNTSNVNLGDVGLYSDCANFTQAGASGGWSASANNVGIPTSTTQVSVSL